MNRALIAVILTLIALCSCVRSWVGRPVTQLQKELGRPRAIRTLGPDQIYVYPDTLAGSGEMTFTVDSKGIIRAWDATPNVPGVFGGDVFGVNDATVNVPTTP
jgi:hypothetical protein